MRYEVKIARRLYSYEPKSGVLFWRVDRIAHLRNHSTFAARKGDVAGWLGKTGYRYAILCGRKRKSTWIIWAIVHGRFPKNQIDHRNRVRDDDRLRNLRDASPSQNICNIGIRSNNTSGYKGVSWSTQRNKWRATIKAHGKQMHLGFFTNPRKAWEAYAVAVHLHHGEFARAV